MELFFEFGDVGERRGQRANFGRDGEAEAVVGLNVFDFFQGALERALGVVAEFGDEFEGFGASGVRCGIGFVLKSSFSMRT